MTVESDQLLRRIPSVTILLADPQGEACLANHPRGLVLDQLRDLLDRKRRDILAGREPALDPAHLWRELDRRLREKAAPRLRRVVNGTGVVIHTNLGRSILGRAATAQIEHIARHYSNLEYDLTQGRRGSRYSHVEALLTELTGAESALVVNNNAAAVLLALDTLARGREVIVSRGQLVEIGGSFRVPEIMSRSGARLREVGTTNKTHRYDYERAITEETALLLKVHTSNFRIQGFTAEVSLEELVDLGQSHGLPVMEDLGSGTMVDLSVYGLEKEPTVPEAVQTGADLVTFSGDKLLGGPQAGVLLGKRSIVQALRTNPLTRALRIDKLTLAALEATLRLYRRPERVIRDIPTLARLAVPPGTLRRQARRLLRLLEKPLADRLYLEIFPAQSQVGGGALPLSLLPTWTLSLVPRAGTVNDLEVHLRSRTVPVIGRIEKDRFLLDLRTLQNEDFPLILEALRSWRAGADPS